ncbi:TetR/AcrR family transcriptional regulator [Acinetobacter sichuanensis]|uniref:TetR/AcrR family transcriptional regulator n=1 Tax=Acinetobacter sichuanensis TaxID=2136183 RepID=UPI00280DCB3A|nr:TetR/AcrR family transcriptional regulator [Acinetobacter sichuanensis]MDQ9021859.1 TetR/AcrR family transcriptional regulator [Acinetobacter sichuanensis]
MPEKNNIPVVRERIMQTAELLFTQFGINAVSLDLIAKQAKTTKMTVYRYFSNKDDLVLEWLKSTTDQYNAVFDTLAVKFPDVAQAQILGFVDYIIENLANAGNRGCPFTNTIAELSDTHHPARILIQQHKKRQLQRLTDLFLQMGVQDPLYMAEELTLLLEGAQVVAQNESIEQIGSLLKKMIAAKLNHAK